MSEIELTAKERKAVGALHAAIRSLGKNIWLFAANGTLCIMRCGEGGEHVTTGGQGMDPDYELARIACDCDGGDW